MPFKILIRMNFFSRSYSLKFFARIQEHIVYTYKSRDFADRKKAQHPLLRLKR